MKTGGDLIAQIPKFRPRNLPFIVFFLLFSWTWCLLVTDYKDVGMVVSTKGYPMEELASKESPFLR
jgi:hypothetical protein